MTINNNSNVDAEKQQEMVVFDDSNENAVVILAGEDGDDYAIKSDYVKFLARYPRIILACFLVFTAGIAIYGFNLSTDLSDGGWYPKSSESYKTGEYFKQFDNVTDPEGLAVLMSHPTWTVDDQQFIDAYEQLKDDFAAADIPTYGYISYFEYSYMSGMVSLDRHKAVLTASLPKKVLDWSGTTPPYDLSDFEDATADSPLSLVFAGELLSNIEATKDINESLETLELGVAPVLIVLLIFAFKGVTAILIPILLIIWNVITTFTALRLVTLGFSVTTYVTNVTTIFGAGLAIDYGLFMHLRFSEELKRHRDDPKFTAVHAVEKTLETSGRTVFFSALLMCATLCGALQFQEYFLATMTLSIMFPAMFAAVGSLTFVPAIYILMGNWIFSLSIEPAEHYLASLFTAASSSFMPVSSKVSDVGGSGKYTKTKAAAPATENDLEGNSDDKAAQRTAYDAVQTKEGSTDSEEQQQPPHQAVTPTGSDQGKTGPSLHTLTEDEEVRNGVWFRMVTFVMKYPWPFALVITGCLVALLSVFVTDARFAQQSYGNFPLDSPTRELAETINSQFPQSNGHTSVDIFVQTTAPFGVRDADFLTALDDLARTLQNTSHVVDVSSMTTIDDSKNLSEYISYYSDPYAEQNVNFTAQLIDPFHLTNFDRVTKLSVSLGIEVSDLRLGEVVRDIRAKVDAAFVADDGSKLVDRWGVSGEAAYQYDINKDVVDTIPYAIIVIVLSMYIFVTLLTGSVVLPFKAIICAGLSLCASFGFLVLVIQNGNGAELLQFRNNLRCLDPLNMVFIVVVSFGLSLDYEVFILGRIHEIYLETGDNNFAVAKGIQTSARSVTMAAILLCATVGGFLAAKMLLLKQIGMGIGLTIVLDATIVRVILVPALMALMGDWNWWSPKQLKDFIDKLGLKH